MEAASKPLFVYNKDMNHKDISSLSPSEYKKELELYESVCKGICEYINSVFKDKEYEFDIIRDSFSKSNEVAVFWIRKKKDGTGDRKDYRHCYTAFSHRNEGGYLKCYMDIMDYWFRNMAINLDDESYGKWTDNVDTPFVCTEENTRKRTYLMFPCYDNIREAIIKIGLRGINLV